MPANAVDVRNYLLTLGFEDTDSYGAGPDDDGVQGIQMWENGEEVISMINKTRKTFDFSISGSLEVPADWDETGVDQHLADALGEADTTDVDNFDAYVEVSEQ